MKKERGFTLVEVLISIAILGIIALAIFFGLSAASKTLFLADERTTAESLAKSRMEWVKNQPYDYGEPPSYSGLYEPVAYAGYAIWVDVALLDQEGDGLEDDDGLQKITVAVYHPYVEEDTSQNRLVLSVEGYKADREQ